LPKPDVGGGGPGEECEVYEPLEVRAGKEGVEADMEGVAAHGSSEGAAEEEARGS
jgi:hypothetical protein